MTHFFPSHTLPEKTPPFLYYIAQKKSPLSYYFAHKKSGCRTEGHKRDLVLRTLHGGLCAQDLVVGGGDFARRTLGKTIMDGYAWGKENKENGNGNKVQNKGKVPQANHFMLFKLLKNAGKKKFEKKFEKKSKKSLKSLKDARKTLKTAQTGWKMVKSHKPWPKTHQKSQDRLHLHGFLSATAIHTRKHRIPSDLRS